MYEIFEQLLKEKGARASDVAKATGINPTVFSDWKKGKSSPKTDKLRKIAEYFGVSVEYLDTGMDSEKESVSGNKYYFDDATAAKAQELFENKELRILFDAAQGASPEDLQMAADLLTRLKKTNPELTGEW